MFHNSVHHVEPWLAKPGHLGLVGNAEDIGLEQVGCVVPDVGLTAPGRPVDKHSISIHVLDSPDWYV